ncbi:MAG: AMP-binding protein, partial [Saprospiraceae bacterium]|nr:AMP-binding protein [Saprospiraceae bacterium]
MQPHLLSDIPSYCRETSSGSSLISEWTGRESVQVSGDAFCERVDRFARALVRIGVRPSDTVCVQSESGRIDVVAVEFAALRIGAVVCPLHGQMNADALTVILQQVRPVLTVFPDEAQRALFQSKVFAETAGELVIVANLLDHSDGRSPGAVPMSADDLALIIYTSGTTGDPKGVMLSHRAIFSNVIGALAIVPLEHDDVVLSFLPISHIFERIVLYTYLVAGVTVHFATSARHARMLFPLVRPHYVTTVPRILEQVYHAFVVAADRGNYFRNAIAQWVMHPGDSHTLLRRIVVRWFVARDLRKVFGRDIKGILVGGAAMDPDIIRFFQHAGIAVREGYGLSECGGVAAVNRFSPGGYLHGTVGIPLPGVEIRIDAPAGTAQGEVLIHSPGNMLGYFQQPDATREVLTDDGWLRTGDIGCFVKDRFLRI